MRSRNELRFFFSEARHSNVIGKAPGAHKFFKYNLFRINCSPFRQWNISGIGVLSLSLSLHPTKRKGQPPGVIALAVSEVRQMVLAVREGQLMQATVAAWHPGHSAHYA